MLFFSFLYETKSNRWIEKRTQLSEPNFNYLLLDRHRWYDQVIQWSPGTYNHCRSCIIKELFTFFKACCSFLFFTKPNQIGELKNVLTYLNQTSIIQMDQPICYNFKTQLSKLLESFSNTYFQLMIVPAGKPYWRGRLCTADLLILTILYQLIYILKISVTFLTKQTTLLGGVPFHQSSNSSKRQFIEWPFHRRRPRKILLTVWKIRWACAFDEKDIRWIAALMKWHFTTLLRRSTVLSRPFQSVILAARLQSILWIECNSNT